MRAPDHGGATFHSSPNFGERRGGVRPDMVVLHYTAMESCAAAAERLCDAECEVSAHYLISEQGEILQLVAEEKRAWHAGAGCWGYVTDVNSRSIGIELANSGFAPFPDQQMAALESLLADILNRRDIAPERVIGHSDMSPGRKTDPGAWFNWQRLARNGLAVWPQEHDAACPDMTRFRECARAFGYQSIVSDAALLAAFRLRFRPGVSGPVDGTDMQMIQDLACRFPVDRSDLNT